MKMSFENSDEVYFFEDQEADRITTYEPYISNALEVLEYLPSGCTILSESAFPNMSCHSFILGILERIADPRNTWVNYGAAEALLKDSFEYNMQETILNYTVQNPSVILFNRVYEKYNRTFPIHSGLLIPKRGVISCVEGVINLASIDSLIEHYSASFESKWGNVYTNTYIKTPKYPINLHKIIQAFGLNLE